MRHHRRRSNACANSLFLRFFAFKAKNDRRTTEERKAPVIENLKSGIDFVTVVTCQGVATRKLVVE